MKLSQLKGLRLNNTLFSHPFFLGGSKFRVDWKRSGDGDGVIGLFLRRDEGPLYQRINVTFTVRKQGRPYSTHVHKSMTDTVWPDNKTGWGYQDVFSLKDTETQQLVDKDGNIHVDVKVNLDQETSGAVGSASSRISTDVRGKRVNSQCRTIKTSFTGAQIRALVGKGESSVESDDHARDDDGRKFSIILENDSSGLFTGVYLKQKSGPRQKIIGVRFVITKANGDQIATSHRLTVDMKDVQESLGRGLRNVVLIDKLGAEPNNGKSIIVYALISPDTFEW